MSEIAQLFTEFFRDLDVVPSDIVAGLVLLRHHQKHRMKTIIAQVPAVGGMHGVLAVCVSVCARVCVCRGGGMCVRACDLY